MVFTLSIIQSLLMGGWKRSKDTVLKSNAGRHRININGALDSDNLEVKIQVDVAINAQSTAKLFKQ